MALSFLYLAFTRILQLGRLSRRDSNELAIEVVILRDEVAVLSRQVVRPALKPQDRALIRRVEPTYGPKMSRSVLRSARNPAPLAPGPGPAEMDLCPPPRSTERPRRHGGDHPSTVPGEPHLGLPPDPGELATMGVVLAP